MEYVIIGNSAAAVGAIESIRRVDQKSNLTVVSSESGHVYSRPLIAHFLAGDVSEDRMPYRPANFYSNYNVTAYLGVNVSEIDTFAEKLRLENTSTLNYDRLLITTGSEVIVPPLPVYAWQGRCSITPVPSG